MVRKETRSLPAHESDLATHFDRKYYGGGLESIHFNYNCVL